MIFEFLSGLSLFKYWVYFKALNFYGKYLNDQLNTWMTTLFIQVKSQSVGKREYLLLCESFFFFFLK